MADDDSSLSTDHDQLVEQTSASARLTVAAVAHRLGVAPSTLRTWDRRYGVGPSAHTAGAHRRYTPEDLLRLQHMRGLVLNGVSPVEAARVALAAQLPAATRQEPFPDRLGRTPAPERRPAPLTIPGADEVVRGLGRAALALDADAVVAIARNQLETYGVLVAWEQVLLPVLVAVGARWAATGEGVEVEHLLSDSVVVALRQHLEGLPSTPPPRPVLLACAPDDLHALPLHALATGLGELGHPSRVLGPSVPQDALHAAVRRTGAAAVFVWSQLPATGRGVVFDGLPVMRPPTVVVAGGPGWDLDELPARVTHAPDLGTAVALVGRALHR